MDLTTVDRVIQGPDAGVISDWWRHIRFRRFLTFIFSVAVMRPLPTTRTAQGYVVKLIWGTYRLEIEKTNNGNNFNHRSWVASSISKRLFNAVGFEPDRDILVSCDNKRTVDSIKKGDIEVKTTMEHADIYTGKKHGASADGLTLKLLIVLSSTVLPHQKHQDIKDILNVTERGGRYGRWWWIRW